MDILWPRWVARIGVTRATEACFLTADRQRTDGRSCPFSDCPRARSQLITCRDRPLAVHRRPGQVRWTTSWPLLCAQRPTPARETPNSSLVHHNAEGRRTQRRVPQLDHLTGRPLACTRRSGRRASSMPAHQALRASCASDSTRPTSSYHGRRSALCGAPTRA